MNSKQTTKDNDLFLPHTRTCKLFYIIVFWYGNKVFSKLCSTNIIITDEAVL